MGFAGCTCCAIILLLLLLSRTLLRNGIFRSEVVISAESEHCAEELIVFHFLNLQFANGRIATTHCLQVFCVMGKMRLRKFEKILLEELVPSFRTHVLRRYVDLDGFDRRIFV